MNIKTSALYPVLVLLLIALSGYAGDTRSGEEINWKVIAGGGNRGNSTVYKLSGTIGQTAVGDGVSGGNVLHHGYHQNLAGAFICDCVPGEVNGIPPINVLDVIYLIDYKFKSGPPPVPYETCSGDVTCDCGVNVLDIIYLIDFKFKSGPDPCSCSDWVGSCGVPIVK